MFLKLIKFRGFLPKSTNRPFLRQRKNKKSVSSDDRTNERNSIRQSATKLGVAYVQSFLVPVYVCPSSRQKKENSSVKSAFRALSP